MTLSLLLNLTFPPVNFGCSQTFMTPVTFELSLALGAFVCGGGGGSLEEAAAGRGYILISQLVVTRLLVSLVHAVDDAQDWPRLRQLHA